MNGSYDERSLAQTHSDTIWIAPSEEHHDVVTTCWASTSIPIWRPKLMIRLWRSTAVIRPSGSGSVGQLDRIDIGEVGDLMLNSNNLIDEKLAECTRHWCTSCHSSSLVLVTGHRDRFTVHKLPHSVPHVFAVARWLLDFRRQCIGTWLGNMITCDRSRLYKRLLVSSMVSLSGFRVCVTCAWRCVHWKGNHDRVFTFVYT